MIISTFIGVRVRSSCKYTYIVEALVTKCPDPPSRLDLPSIKFQLVSPQVPTAPKCRRGL